LHINALEKNMTKMTCKLALNSFLFVLMLLSHAWALPPAVQVLVDMETKGNGAAIRSNAPVKMPHYEIPLEYMKETSIFNLNPAIYNALVFEKNGEKYVRWVVNPEDTKWFKDVEAFMKKKGLAPERKYYFTGYQTASRSYIVEDPAGSIQFSIKTSTDKTGGNWRDKKQPLRDGEDAVKVSDFISRIEEAKPFESVVVMKEPLLFGIPEVDQSIVVREIGDLATGKGGKVIYLPAFSVLHESVGRKIAEKNGSKDPVAFWREHYILPMAKAAAEIYARSGIWFDSPHGQNFLVEFDSSYKPTGRIVMRDLSDVLLTEQVSKALDETRLLREFSDPDSIVKESKIGFGPLHGNVPPSWISEASYEQWGHDFRKAFRREFIKQTHLDPNKVPTRLSTTEFSYYGVSLDITDQTWKEYLPQIQKPVKFCSSFFLY
jgi:hypothetical protein